MAEQKISIIIADDHPLIRRGLRDVLESETLCEILAETGNGEEAMELIRKFKPDVALVDFDMPKMTGVEIARRVSDAELQTNVVMLTMHDNEDIFRKALAAGVMGYVLKDEAMSEIVECIKTVVTGKQFVSRSLTPLLLRKSDSAMKGIERKLGLSELTSAERKVLALIAQSKTTKDIAEELYISPRTVDRHRANICEKLNLAGSNALLKFALENKSIL